MITCHDLSFHQSFLARFIQAYYIPIVKDKGQLSDVSLSFFFQDSGERLILTDRTVAIYMKE
jgi:hypothetical protein